TCSPCPRWRPSPSACCASLERGFLPGRRFTDWADANRQARAWWDRVNARPKRQLKATPRELFAAEHPALRRLPRWIPEPYLVHERLVDVEGYITLDTNHYSVPTVFIGRRLEVRETPNRIIICDGPREITTHEREVDRFVARVVARRTICLLALRSL